MANLDHALHALLFGGALIAADDAFAHADLATFDPSAFSKEPATVDCTLENGAAAKCYEFTVNYLPEGLEIGPFCPETHRRCRWHLELDRREWRALSH
jgi:hypothetical protein